MLGSSDMKRLSTALALGALLLVLPFCVASCGGCGASTGSGPSEQNGYQMSPTEVVSWCDTITISKLDGGQIPANATVTFKSLASPSTQYTGGTVDSGVMYAGLPKNAAPGDYSATLN